MTHAVGQIGPDIEMIDQLVKVIDLFGSVQIIVNGQDDLSGRGLVGLDFCTGLMVTGF
ncbi:MAG: hypothetical protein Alpg2KO_19050 [Alphaproteobacteria bacterium]